MTDPHVRLTAALADRYRIERELGQGGMATVYLAEDRRHRRQVAVKVLRPELAAALGAERFLREITTTAGLTHPHIVPVFDSGEAAGHLFFVMPLIEGESLRARLERDGPLPVDEAVRLVREVADALEYAHGAGILHRDLKPENIMLSRGHALLADFGIARATDASGGERITQTGTSVGTPAYMSPEQATGERDLGPPSDVYGLGAILYELLTGGPPFTGPTFEAILVKRFTQEAPRCRSRRADTPAACDAAVARALARDPGERFPSARAFADALMTAGGPVAAPQSAPVSQHSIVVLPFVNQSPDPDNEFFSDGLTEEIITDLSRVRALSILSRTSSMQLKGTAKSVRTLGQELGVRYALAGSVRRAGASLRITAELIDAVTDTPVWAEKYSGTVDDVFDVQERVAREIVRALDVTLTPAEDRRLADRPVKDARAFELYLRARDAIRRYGPETERGIALVEQAIAIEGETPPLRGLRALALIYMVRSGMHHDQRPLDRADSEARALIALVPDAAYAHALIGFVALERGDQREAVRALRASLERDPRDPDVLLHLAVALGAAGQAQAELEVADRWLAADPLAPMAWLLKGVSRWFLGTAVEGVPYVERARELEPENIMVAWSLGYTYALVGRAGDAAALAEWLVAHAPQMPYTVQLRSLVAAIQGQPADALAALSAVDTAPLDGHQNWHLAESCAMAGDQARALALLERAVGQGWYAHDFWAQYDPFFQPLRGSGEFARIMARAAQRAAEFAE